jgi:hypothetical protein
MKTTLGLDQDLINAVTQIVESSCSSKKMEKEELHPNQVKLDKNKNGKLDSDDFKKLRKEEETDENYVSHAQRKAVWASKNEKGVKEDVEQIDELSTSTLDNYRTKANSSGYNSKTTQQKLDNRSKGMNLAWSKTMPAKNDEMNPNKAKVKAGDYRFNKEEFTLEDYSVEEIEEFMMSEDFEQLDELSKKTLKSYVKGAKADAKANRADYEYTKNWDKDQAKSSVKQAQKREAGIRTATNKLTKEQLDELSKDTLKSYVAKAEPQADKLSDKYSTQRFKRDKTHGQFSDDTPALAKLGHKAAKRDDGVYLAKKKLNKEQMEEIETLAAKHGLGE